MKNTRGGARRQGQTAPVRQLACTALRSSFRDGSLNLFVWHTHVKAPVRTGRVACVHSIVHSPGEFREAEPFRDAKLSEPVVLKSLRNATISSWRDFNSEGISCFFHPSANLGQIWIAVLAEPLYQVHHAKVMAAAEYIFLTNRFSGTVVITTISLLLYMFSYFFIQEN